MGRYGSLININPSFKHHRRSAFSFLDSLTLFFHFIFDPRGQPTVTAGSDHYFRTCYLSVRPSVLPYVRPRFSKSRKTKNFKRAKWIIDDTHVFLFPFSLILFFFSYLDPSCRLAVGARRSRAAKNFFGGSSWIWKNNNNNFENSYFAISLKCRRS